MTGSHEAWLIGLWKTSEVKTLEEIPQQEMSFFQLVKIQKPKPSNCGYVINLFQTKRGSVPFLTYPIHHARTMPPPKVCTYHQPAENTPQASISYNGSSQ